MSLLFFLNAPATTELYTLSLHDALPILLAVGDAGFQKKCLSVMEDLRRGGRTVLFVSHNMAAVENLCSRGIWIDGGRVRREDRKSTRLNSSHRCISYAVFCLKKKKTRGK